MFAINLDQVVATVQRPVEITRETLLGLISSWLESRDLEWIKKINAPVVADGLTIKDFKTGAMSHPDWPASYLIMVHPKCHVPFVFEDVENEGVISFEMHVNLESCIRGLNVLAKKNPKRFDNIVNGNYDANDAEAWAECMVYGDIVFA